MIIDSLVKLYESRYVSELPYGWQKRKAIFALNVSIDGDLLGIIQLGNNDREFILPVEPSGRTSNCDKPAFLCDNGGYFLSADIKHGTEKYENSKRLHLSILEQDESLAGKAIKAYFTKDSFRSWDKVSDLTEEDISKAVFIFQIERNGKTSVFADYNDTNLRKVWSEYYSLKNKSQNEIICLVTGKLDQVENTHNRIKLKVKGSQSSGALLVSANSSSFTSYGKTEKDSAADIGKYAAFAYTTALNELLEDENQHQIIGNDMLVYWADGGIGKEEEIYSIFSQPTEETNDIIDSVISNISRGLPVELTSCNLESRFHLLCLSPNGGRISVRFFKTNSFGKILLNNVEHYKRLEIYEAGNNRFKYTPLWKILNETTIKNKNSDVLPLLGGRVLMSILSNQRYPIQLYNAIINRIKAGKNTNGEITKTKAAMIKAILIKNYNESEVTTVSLNKETNNTAYVLGRLFSTLEKLQSNSSGGKLNSTIRDRFFSSACSTPGNVFPILLRLSMYHSAKIENSVFFEKLKTELLGKLDIVNPFPAVLSLENQGKFILGYYHQVQEFFTPKKEKEEKKDE